MSSLSTGVDLNAIDNKYINDIIDLINGFIRNIEGISELTIPEPINLLVMAFYYVTYKFDICSEKDQENVIKSDGKIFSKDLIGGDHTDNA